MSDDAVERFASRDVAELAAVQDPPVRSVDDASVKLENFRAGLAQASAIVPLVGPGIAHARNPVGSFARREAAKAFNGQVTMVVTAAVLLGPYILLSPWIPWLLGPVSFVAAILLGWGVQAVAGAVSAFSGRDWTSPVPRVIRVTILPEGDPDPTRTHRKGGDHV